MRYESKGKGKRKRHGKCEGMSESKGKRVGITVRVRFVVTVGV